MSVLSGGGPNVRPEFIFPTSEAEGRLLLLIAAFTTRRRGLEGRTKLAKLDFLLRYPIYFKRALYIRAGVDVEVPTRAANAIEHRMVRYRFGPWDPAYFVVLGRLIGRGLVDTAPFSSGLAYLATSRGSALAAQLRDEEVWTSDARRIALLKRHFDLSGTTLKNFVYEHFPEVTTASWGEPL